MHHAGADHVPSYRLDRHGDVTVATLAGDLDLACAGRIGEVLALGLDGGAGLVVDLSGATFLDSSVIATLLAWRRHAVARDVSLAVACPPGCFARRVLELYGLDDGLAVVPTREAAVRMLSRWLPAQWRHTLRSSV